LVLYRMGCKEQEYTVYIVSESISVAANLFEVR